MYRLQKEFQLLKNCLRLFKGGWWVRFDVPWCKHSHSFCGAHKYWAVLCVSLWTLLISKKIPRQTQEKALGLEGQIFSACCNHDEFSTSAILTCTDLAMLFLRSDTHRRGFKRCSSPWLYARSSWQRDWFCLCQFNYINQITSSHEKGDPPSWNRMQ